MSAQKVRSLAIDVASKRGSLEGRMAMLGIPGSEMTPAVKLAVSALLEKLDDTSHELNQTREALAEMERLVDVDCVVPIPNRRAFMRRLNWAISMFERYGHHCSVLYFDLNDFKQINDTYGHAAGDLAIQHAASLITGSVRESDFVARLGGDEFAVIMLHADEAAARMRAQHITERMNSTPFMFGGRNITVHAACGIHTIKNGDSAQSSLASADMSMYVDKRRSKMLTFPV